MIEHIDITSDSESVNCRDDHSMSSSEENTQVSPQKEGKKRKKNPESKTALKKKERELNAVERKRKQAMRPGNCLKLIKVIISADILQNSDYAGDLILALNKAEIGYKVDVNPEVQSSIFWERQDPLNEDSIESEAHAVVFIAAKHFINLISTYKLKENVQEIQSSLEEKQLTLIIYGMENYFRFQKTKKNRELTNEVRGQSNKNPKGEFADSPKVSRQEVECSLAELQILYNCGHCFFESPSQIASYICQYSKAVAEAPYKLEKKSKEEEQLEWFALGDSKGVVRIDKHGNGLARLWRQQLCQFNLAGLDSSEAIASTYPSPKALTKAYNELLHEDAQLMLQNIQLRRAVGPISSERRIGPQLSRKMHTFFTGLDGNLDISKD